MKPRDLAAAIRKRGWLIIVITIMAALIATVAARVQTPSYKVEIKVSAIAPIDPQTGQPNATIAIGYITIMPSVANSLESINIARAAHDRLLANGIDIPAEELLAKVKSESDPNTSFATVTVTDKSPTRVAEIANAWGDAVEIQASDDLTVQNTDLKQLLLSGKLIVTNEAVPPKKPTQPKPLVYLGLGIFLGLVLGFSTAIGIEYFDPHFRSTLEVEETLDLPVLGTVPKLKGAEAISVLSSGSQMTPANEAYSQLRSSIMFSISGRPSKSILVIATIPTEEAPYVAANLATSIAFTERKTLLMDCDLRQQSLSRIMKVQDQPGLADCLAKRGPIKPVIIKAQTPFLSLIAAGRPSGNSSDLLSLPLMDDYLRELEREYDQLIIYAPALTLAIDGVVVASKVDLSLVVVDSERCSRSIVQSAMESFNMLHLKPTGVVLSNVKIMRRERALRSRIASEVNKQRAKAEVVGIDKEKRVVQEPKQREEGRGKPSWRPQPEAPAAEATRPPAARPSPVAMTPQAEGEAEPAARIAELKAEPMAPKAEPPTATAPMPSAPISTAKDMAEAKPAGPGPEPVTEKMRHRGDLLQDAGAKPHTEIAPMSATNQKTEEELAQLKEILTDDFRRMGSSGASIPRDWLRALNSEKPEVRELAKIAISAYYMAFLRRYDISEESVKRITESIIRMMRKEGEFASMNEKEAQSYLQKMLVDAGARFSSGQLGNRPTTGARGAQETSIGGDTKVGKERKRRDRRFFKQETSTRKTGEVQKNSKTPPSTETKLWQDAGGEEDWEWE